MVQERRLMMRLQGCKSTARICRIAKVPEQCELPFFTPQVPDQGLKP